MKSLNLYFVFTITLLYNYQALSQCNINIPSNAVIGSADLGGSGSNLRWLCENDVVSSNGGGSNTYFIEDGGIVNSSGGGSHIIYVKNGGKLNIEGGGGSISVFYESNAIINNNLTGGGSNTFNLCQSIIFNYSSAPSSSCNQILSTGEIDIKLNGIVSAENNQIKNISDPTHSQDAATKSYIDSLISDLQEQINVLQSTSNPGTSVFTEADPDINDGIITFEETGPSFSAENMQPVDRSVGNWNRFGGNENGNVSIEYVENPDKTDPNESDNVVEVTEPAGVESWAGFYFMLNEKINFPVGKEAIKFDFYSPGPGHNVLLKLEDELPNGNDGKKSTGDLFAVTEGTGWETLVFNVPEGKIEDGAYNTMTMILGFGLSNDAEVKYYIDNFDFATPKNVPTDAPNAPTYPADEVISIFSDAYTDVEGTDFNPAWGQSTNVYIKEIALNNVLKYEGLNYQGTAFASALDVSGKTKLHIDYFTGDSTTLNFFLISSFDEKAFALDVNNVGEWNSVYIDLSHYSDVVDLSDVIYFKVEGNGTVYFDNIYFFGGGLHYSPDYSGTFGGTSVTNGVFEFPSSAQDWAGFANENQAIYPLAFPNGGKVTFNAATAGTDIQVKFRFEADVWPNVDPAYDTSIITVSRTDLAEYSVDIPPQGENTFKSALFYLVTRDQQLTAYDFVITSYD